jgi:hypothetical protein
MVGGWQLICDALAKRKSLRQQDGQMVPKRDFLRRASIYIRSMAPHPVNLQNPDKLVSKGGQDFRDFMDVRDCTQSLLPAFLASKFKICAELCALASLRITHLSSVFYAASVVSSAALRPGMKCDFLELTAWQAASPRYFRRPFQPRKQHHERRF